MELFADITTTRHWLARDVAAKSQRAGSMDEFSALVASCIPMLIQQP